MIVARSIKDLLIYKSDVRYTMLRINTHIAIFGYSDYNRYKRCLLFLKCFSSGFYKLHSVFIAIIKRQPYLF